MFNPKMFKVKKKRAVDPNAPPRPNLMSHDKTIRETNMTIANMQSVINHQAEEIAKLKSQLNNVQLAIGKLVERARRGS